jgi:hypothetical protein
MARFTKALRQQIVREFAEQNGGWFDPALFLETVREAGEDHPAYDWFEWDDDKAALEYRLDQARDFARGLVVRFEIEEVHRGKMRIAEHSAPLIISPLGKRREGGGYFVTDPDDAEHMEELRKQAAQSLRWFLSRYNAVLAHCGVSVAALERVQAQLEDQTEHKEAA